MAFKVKADIETKAVLSLKSRLISVSVRELPNQAYATANLSCKNGRVIEICPELSDLGNWMECPYIKCRVVADTEGQVRNIDPAWENIRAVYLLTRCEWLEQRDSTVQLLGENGAHASTQRMGPPRLLRHLPKAKRPTLVEAGILLENVRGDQAIFIADMSPYTLAISFSMQDVLVFCNDYEKRKLTEHRT